MHINFAKETERKNTLLHLFKELGGDEFRSSCYDRTFNGIVKVARIGKSSLSLLRENGKAFGVLLVTSEIARLTRASDQFLVSIGHCNNMWNVIAVYMIGSFVKDESGLTRIHLSGSGLSSLPGDEKASPLRH